ncbi:hypothetical protein QWY31_09090 [Cytophagales bacterium LB-30]|uniref:Uncharacterized protein n=2 Tax=Shiella aurantiaca TaxID=3058365 RepID=A0ABT8F602_9BACT|nr:hypothetical protein [Shiella aurantiaca]
MVLKIGEVTINNIKINVIETAEFIDLDVIINHFGEMSILLYRHFGGLVQIEARGNLENLITIDLINNINWREINI